MNRLHIKKHLSVRLQTIANNYGLTTIGQLKTMLSRMRPSAKLSLPLTHMRVTTVRRILERELKELSL
jgi:hypothetical protein